MTLKEEMEYDIEQHPLDRNPDVLARAMKEIARLERLVEEAPLFFHPGYDFDGEKLRWIERANLGA